MQAHGTVYGVPRLERELSTDTGLSEYLLPLDRNLDFSSVGGGRGPVRAWIPGGFEPGSAEQN